MAKRKSRISEELKNREIEYYEEYFNYLISLFHRRYEFLHTILIKEDLKVSSSYTYLEYQLKKWESSYNKHLKLLVLRLLLYFFCTNNNVIWLKLILW